MSEEEPDGPGPAARADRLTVASNTVRGIAVLTPAGELDLNSVDTLRRALDEAAATCTQVVLDLHRLTFMDSAGINLFLTAHRSLAEAGGRLRLAAPTGPVLRVLQIVGITTVIDCSTTLDDALTT